MVCPIMCTKCIITKLRMYVCIHEMEDKDCAISSTENIFFGIYKKPSSYIYILGLGQTFRYSNIRMLFYICLLKSLLGCLFLLYQVIFQSLLR